MLIAEKRPKHEAATLLDQLHGAYQRMGKEQREELTPFALQLAADNKIKCKFNPDQEIPARKQSEKRPPRKQTAREQDRQEN